MQAVGVDFAGLEEVKQGIFTRFGVEGDGEVYVY